MSELVQAAMKMLRELPVSQRDVDVVAYELATKEDVPKWAAREAVVAAMKRLGSDDDDA